MPELESISIKGFKSIKSIERLELRDINVIIGPNGAGKSNFIGAFSFLHSLREGKLQEYVIKEGGAENVLHFGSKETQQVTFEIYFKDQKNSYLIQLISAGTDELSPSEEMVYFWNKKLHPEGRYGESLNREGKEAGISRPHGSGIVGYVRDHLTKWRLYHFHDTSSGSLMKKTTDVNDNRFLRPDGSNLPAFLYLLKQNHPASYQLIRRLVQRVAPFFDDFQLEPLALNKKTIQLEWSHKMSDKFFDASALSDGTLRFIALATLFLQPKEYRPSVILVDEPELGLHPYAITMLASAIKQASCETQVIIATQSPLLLDHFTPDDVLVTNQIDGATEFSRLNTDNLGSWLEDYSLGQLWEKNEFAGRPSTF
jgi:predicted ATPase